MDTLNVVGDTESRDFSECHPHGYFRDGQLADLLNEGVQHSDDAVGGANEEPAYELQAFLNMSGSVWVKSLAKSSRNKSRVAFQTVKRPDEEPSEDADGNIPRPGEDSGYCLGEEPHKRT